MTRPGAFDTALAFVLQQEGGYANHPADRGGATNRGITQSTYDTYRHSLHLPRADVQGITDQEVTDIYRTRYWRPAGCDVLDQLGADRLALLHFDAAVNHGVGRAVIFLQLSLQMPGTDGIFGPHTGAACREALHDPAGQDQLIDAYLLRRRVFYERIVERDPSQAVFARGWAKRLEHVRRAVVPT